MSEAEVPNPARKKTDVFGMSWVLCWAAVLMGMWIADTGPANPERWRASTHPRWWWVIDPTWFVLSISAGSLIVAGVASWTVQRIRVVLWKRKGRRIRSDLLRILEVAAKSEEAKRKAEGR